MPATRPSPRRSRDESPLPERLEDDVLERLRGVGADVPDVVASAEALELLGVRIPGLDVRRRESRCDLDLAHLAGFRIHEPDLAERSGVAVAFGGDVDDEDIVAERAQDLDAGLEAAGVEEVRDDHGQAELARPRREFLERGTQIGGPGRLEPLEILEHPEDPPLAAARRRLLTEPSPERQDGQLIEV